MFAGVLGLAGFVAACVAGIGAGADPIGVLWRAVTAMVICSIVGALLGRAGMVAVREHIDAHRARHPIPEPDEPNAGPAPAEAPASPTQSAQAA